MDEIDILEAENKAYKRFFNRVQVSTMKLKQELEIIKPFKRSAKVKTKEIDQIKEAILEEFGIKWSDIQSISKKRYTNAYPRQMYIHLVLMLIPIGMTDLGLTIRKGYDHSMVHYSKKTAKNMMHPKFGIEYFQEKYYSIKINLHKRYGFDMDRFEDYK